jgi:hypothetical protein
MKQPERIEIGSAGFGEASRHTLEERARQIALSDGRTEVNDLDREEARRQITDPISERKTRQDFIAEGDRPDAGVAPSSTGSRMEKVSAEDESFVAENLVREGIEEAEFDTRLRSAEENESDIPESGSSNLSEPPGRK